MRHLSIFLIINSYFYFISPRSLSVIGENILGISRGIVFNSYTQNLIFWYTKSDILIHKIENYIIKCWRESALKDNIFLHLSLFPVICKEIFQFFNFLFSHFFFFSSLLSFTLYIIFFFFFFSALLRPVFFSQNFLKINSKFFRWGLIPNYPPVYAPE